MNKSTFLDMAIGKTLVLCRLEAAISQQELSQRTSISQARISRLESGHASMWIVELLEICPVLNTTYRKFIGRVERAKLVTKMGIEL